MAVIYIRNCVCVCVSQGDNKATVFVSNLQHNANEQELKDLFGKVTLYMCTCCMKQ